jgi:hypothetical protein
MASLCPTRMSAAVLLYQPALDARIVRAYGHVPAGVRAVVVTSGELYWPSRWDAEWLRRRLADWRAPADTCPTHSTELCPDR